jgi:hypothetical protein
MDTTALEAAYRRLLDVARAGGFRPPADAGAWPAELQLAHVVATDRLLAATTAELIAGGSQLRYDNLAATTADYLADIGRAAGDWAGLVAAARQGGLELVLLARRLSEAQAATPVPVRIRDGEAVRVDAALPWAGVLHTHAEVHLAEHTAALAALR